MDTISFISTESGTDLIVAFAVVVPDEPSEIESLILLRTPKYEPLLDDWERGVRVSFGNRNDDDDDLLEEVAYTEDDCVVRLKTTGACYELDVRQVNRQELRAMRRVLRKMNCDGRIRLSGV